MNLNTTKNIIKLEYLLYSFLIGMLVGLVIWIFLQLMNLGLYILWDYIPNTFEFPFYSVVIGIIGGIIIGIEQKKFGAYPQEMSAVFTEIKETGDYGKGKILLLFCSALLPLIFAAPLGPEAGAIGLIAAICMVVRKILSNKKIQLYELTEVSISAGLATLFNAPLFGLTQLDNKDESQQLKHPYANISAVIGGFSAIYLLHLLTGFGIGGVERFSSSGNFELSYFIYFVPIILIGSLFGLVFNWFEILNQWLLKPLKNYPIIKGILCGSIIGIVFLFEPIILFSGEEQLGELAQMYASYSSLSLIFIALIKLFLINFCMVCGWRGGHFFPAIFCGSCLGFGLSLIFSEIDPILCIALSCSSLLGALLKRPLPVVFLLLLCYPVSYILFLFTGAVISTTLANLLNKYVSNSKEIKNN